MGLDHQPVLYSYLKDAPRTGGPWGRQAGKWVPSGGLDGLTENHILIGDASNEPEELATGAAGRAALAAADAAALRTAAGLGTMATEAATDYWKRDANATWSGAHIFQKEIDIQETSSHIRTGRTTGNASKEGLWRMRHYDSDVNVDCVLFYGIALETVNYCLFGGGTSAYNAATDVLFYAGANTTSKLGIDDWTVRVRQNSLEMKTGSTLTADTIAAADGSGIAISHNLNMASGKKISTNTKIGAAVAVPASFADLAAVRTYLASILD